MYLTQDQRQIISNVVFHALVEIHTLCADGRAKQAADLAEAICGLPTGMWSDDYDLREFRDSFVAEYQQKYPTNSGYDYVGALEEAIALGW